MIQTADTVANECPLDLLEAAACILNTKILLDRLADEEKPEKSPLRRGFLTCGELEDVLVSLMALAHYTYPELSDPETLDVALRESGVNRLSS